MFLNRSSFEIQNYYKTIVFWCINGVNTVESDIILCIPDYLPNCVVNEIKKCKCYSVQVDDTTDITQRTQCSIILR